MIEKKKLVSAMIAQLENDLMVVKQAALATYEEATSEESKPENEYDTRGLEASYLAGAQAKRAGEIDEVLSLFQHARWKDFTAKDPISITALIEVESEGKRSLLFLMPKGGGFASKYEGITVQVVTPVSHLGEAIIGLKQGDVADVEVRENIRPYKILSVS